MKVAVLGPIAKDFIKIDGKVTVQIGGIPYYVSLALKFLGAEEVVPYVTCGQNDNDWVINNFFGLTVNCLPVEKTLEAYIEYTTDNPDVRLHRIKYYPSAIALSDKLERELSRFDYIILGPLFHDNIPFDLFKKLKSKNLILGNFGIFTYEENGKLIRKNPENLIKVLPFLKYLFLDSGEVEFVSGRKGVKKSAEFLQSQGLPNIIITEGSKGSHIFMGKKYFKIPAFPPKQIADTTGAGDTYEAAYIRAIELFSEPEKRGRFAAMAATMSLENKGGFKGSDREVKERLRLNNL